VSGLGLIMPTKNVTKMVGQILNGILESQWKSIHRIVIIDNASSDGSLDTIRENDNFKAHVEKFFIVQNLTDKGYGHSLKTGIDQLSQNSDVEFIGVIHSDDQFSSSELLDLYIEFMNKSSNQVLLVARTKNANSSFSLRQEFRNIGNLVLSQVAKLSTGAKLEDFNTPFFIVSRKIIEEILSDYDLIYDIFFHPRINLILTTQYETTYGYCKWKRATETLRIPISNMGLYLLFMYMKFGFLYRICRLDFKKCFASVNRGGEYFWKF